MHSRAIVFALASLSSRSLPPRDHILFCVTPCSIMAELYVFLVKETDQVLNALYTGTVVDKVHPSPSHFLRPPSPVLLFLNALISILY